MNKKDLQILLGATLTSIIWMSLVYLLTAFCNWEINPKNWEFGGRYIFASLGGAIGLVLGIAYYLNKYYENKIR